MTLKYTIEAEDWRAFVASVAIGASGNPRDRTAAFQWNVGVWFVIGLLTLIGLNLVNRRPPQWVGYGFLGFALASASWVGVIALLQSRASARSAPREGSAILGDYLLEVTPDGIVQTRGNHRNESQWPGIVEVRHGRGHIFLMVDSCAAYIVPRRAFETEDQEREFLKTVNDLRRAISSAS